MYLHQRLHRIQVLPQKMEKFWIICVHAAHAKTTGWGAHHTHQVIAGLVQQQDVRLLKGDAGERDARLLTAAQRVHGLQRQLAAHPERAQMRPAG